MDPRHPGRRWFSPVLFALIGLCFLLPFGTVSCEDKTTTFTGAQLATWTVPEGGVVNDADLAEQIEGEGSGLALVTLVACVLGVLLGLIRMSWGEGWCAAAGLVTTLILGVKAANSLATTLHAGYLLALLLFLCAAVLHASRDLRRRRASRRPVVPKP
jgi:hypothetical protein